ncbi:MAG TPA: UDP-glucose/GDP-mannose dehydrogenase family protein [Ignavibacteriaceae bacterium]|nr:UDP-glucose/GDP-mannose dehydrogenase family protein [Ignavibacteriaceae bacterium]
MNISIFGLGYVGCVSLGCLAQNGHIVIGVDVSETKVDLINRGIATIVEKDIDEIIRAQFNSGKIRATKDPKEAVLNTEISIIAVGTPSSVNGHLVLDYIYKVVENIADALKQKNGFHVIAIRSTVLPGTCEKAAKMIEKISGKIYNKDFTVVSNPEFLREGTAVNDYFHPPYTLIGSDSKSGSEKMSQLYNEIDAEIVITSIKEAEIIKYVNNTFHALKVSFANEIGNICKTLGVDSLEVMKIFVKDKQLNISPYYLRPGFAYGGSCLPKDLKALQTLAHDLYLDTPVIQSINKSNDIQIKRAEKIITDCNKNKIGILGLSFKEGTDDLRNSPSVNLIETLIGKGFTIKIYDKSVQYSQLTGRNKDYIDQHIPHLAKLMESDIEQVISISELLVVSTREKEFDEVLRNIHDKKIIDLVGLDKELLNKPNYFGINW